VRFARGREEGFRALAVALQHRLFGAIGPLSTAIRVGRTGRSPSGAGLTSFFRALFAKAPSRSLSLDEMSRLDFLAVRAVFVRVVDVRRARLRGVVGHVACPFPVSLSNPPLARARSVRECGAGFCAGHRTDLSWSIRRGCEDDCARSYGLVSCVSRTAVRAGTRTAVLVEQRGYLGHAPHEIGDPGGHLGGCVDSSFLLNRALYCHRMPTWSAPIN
jgi:hypothetical protein